MRVELLVVGPFAVNCYVVSESPGGPAMVIDPGFEPDLILRTVRRERLAVEVILNTHGHADHMGENGAIKAAFPKAVLAIHEADAAALGDPFVNLSALFGFEATSPPADRLLRDGDRIELGRLRFEVLHLPGHSPGGIGLARSAEADEPPVLFTGDALFAGSIGRTDFPGGNYGQLLRGIRDRLLTWPNETRVYPGHGDATTIGKEKRGNPFLA